MQRALMLGESETESDTVWGDARERRERARKALRHVLVESLLLICLLNICETRYTLSHLTPALPENESSHTRSTYM